jgi:hypothetical protein
VLQGLSPLGLLKLGTVTVRELLKLCRVVAVPRTSALLATTPTFPAIHALNRISSDDDQLVDAG